MNWEFFLALLTDREKSFVEGMLVGLNGAEIGRSLGLNPSTIRYLRIRLTDKMLEHFWPDILVEIRKMPGWKKTTSTVIGKS